MHFLIFDGPGSKTLEGKAQILDLVLFTLFIKVKSDFFTFKGNFRDLDLWSKQLGFGPFLGLLEASGGPSRWGTTYGFKLLDQIWSNFPIFTGQVNFGSFLMDYRG